MTQENQTTASATNLFTESFGDGYLPFRAVYNSCFANGISLAESTTIHIKRAITTLTRDAKKFRHMQIRLSIPSAINNRNQLAVLLHETYPDGFFSDNLFIGLEEADGGEYPVLVMHDLTVHGNLRTFEIAYVPNEKFDALLEKLKQFEFKPAICIRSISDVGQDGSVHAEEVEFNPETELFPTGFFYPFIAEIYGQRVEDFKISDFVNDFLTSRDNALIFTGPKGTGKTSLGKCFYVPNYEINSIASATVLDKPDVIKTFRFKPKEDGYGMLTIYDEADNFLKSKESGNPIMGALLAHLDGPVPSKEKFVFLSNLATTREVDDRLLRIGRCHLSVQFRNLTPQEANAARESIGLPAYVFATSKISLVDAIHAGRDNNRNAGRSSFGFAPA